MGTVEVAHWMGSLFVGWVLWEWLIACWMGTVGVVDCLLDGYCSSGSWMGTVGVVDFLLDGYCGSGSVLNGWVLWDGYCGNGSFDGYSGSG